MSGPFQFRLRTVGLVSTTSLTALLKSKDTTCLFHLCNRCCTKLIVMVYHFENYFMFMNNNVNDEPAREYKHISNFVWILIPNLIRSDFYAKKCTWMPTILVTNIPKFLLRRSYNK